MYTSYVFCCLLATVIGIPQELVGVDEIPDYYDDPLIPAEAPPPKRQIQIQVPRQQQQEQRQQQPSSSSSHRFSAGSSSSTSFLCPEPFGLFADPHQCDKYYECDNDTPYDKLCDDGLVFDIAKGSAGHADPCDSPYVVDCTDRPDLQEPTFTSDFCPRRHGLFADPDSAICNKYYTCIKGAHSVTSCATGLHFDEITGTCTWPAAARRTGCSAIVAETSINGFVCPNEEVVNAQGVKIPHPTYANDDDCARFYVCLNGVKPQEASCSLGKVYNAISQMCDYPENVPECAKYYENYEYLYEDTPVDAQSTVV